MPNAAASGSGRSRRRAIPLGFGGITARVGDHIAHFYDTSEQQIRVLGPFIATGLRNGDRCVSCAPRPIRGLRKWLTSEGIRPEKVKESRQFLITTGSATARTQGKLITVVDRETEADSYPLLRLAGDGCGIIGDGEPPAELLRWELVYDNSFARRRPVIGLCQYDLKRFRGDTIISLLRLHPLCIVGDQLIRNPFYAPPSQHGVTPREIEILQHIAWGKTAREIASALGIGDRTVQTHVAHILEKLGVPSRAGAAAKGVREGIVE